MSDHINQRGDLMFLTVHPATHAPFFPFFIFPIVFFCLLITAILIFRFMNRRYGCRSHSAGVHLEAEEILKLRLINHEISEEEYLKMKELLKK